jgi:hypothetical protein
VLLNLGAAPQALAPGDEPGASVELAIRVAPPIPSADGRVRVEFTLRDASPARLVLLDLAGRALASHQVGTMGPGFHVIDLAGGRAMAPGIYLIDLTQGPERARTRAAVLR